MVTVIVAVPTLFAVTVPLVTLAIELLLLDQVTLLLVALVGKTVAVKDECSPTFKLNDVGETLTLSTLTVLDHHH